MHDRLGAGCLPVGLPEERPDEQVRVRPPEVFGERLLDGPDRMVVGNDLEVVPDEALGHVLEEVVLVQPVDEQIVQAAGADLLHDVAPVVVHRTLRDENALARIWFQLGATPQYYPLVHTGFWIEYRLWGLDATGYQEFLDQESA